MSKERLEALLSNPAIQHKEILWGINYAKEQAERAQELEVFTDESSKKHAELNVFLQRRKKTAKYLGKHVVDAVMEYAQDLESRVADDEHYIV